MDGRYSEDVNDMNMIQYISLSSAQVFVQANSSFTATWANTEIYYSKDSLFTAQLKCHGEFMCVITWLNAMVSPTVLGIVKSYS